MTDVALSFDVSVRTSAEAELDTCLCFDCRKRKLQVTELLPEEIESGLEKVRPEEDVQRIEELMNLPRNPSSPEKQDQD